MALGAIEAIKGSGLNVKDFAIAGVDGVSDALRLVKNGEMMSILQDGRAQMQGQLMSLYVLLKVKITSRSLLFGPSIVKP